jgi:hypothetical protein
MGVSLSIKSFNGLRAEDEQQAPVSQRKMTDGVDSIRHIAWDETLNLILNTIRIASCTTTFSHAPKR